MKQFHQKSFSCRKSFLALAGALALSVMVQAGTTARAADTDTACDPQLMDAIEARGFAEAARENVQNQNLIFKGDSVIEYSCFRYHVPPVQKEADHKFLQPSLEVITTNPMEKFVYTNFGDVFLNSRYTDPSPAMPVVGGDMCNAMVSVWEISRCMNFYHKMDLESFFDLTHYTSNDPRQLPVSLGACSQLPYSSLNMALDIAYNNRRPAWTIPGPFLRDTIVYKSDPIDLQNKMYKPGECGDPIPTGMKVLDFNSPKDDTPFDEKICANPACQYMPDTDKCTMP